ncbi:30S ribosomal protein S8e [Candidatus Woesearchaeota archaeon]|nr:30S ribosomal protein S8e [Candidatus Woesearchaeota archaeon]
MTIIQSRRSGHTPSGGMYTKYRKKKKYELGHSPTLTIIGEKDVVKVRTKFNGKKLRVRSTDTINAFDPKKKAHAQAKIKTVKENSANRNFVRMNVITKGAIIDTDLGKVKVTNRPGQEGVINGILV